MRERKQQSIGAFGDCDARRQSVKGITPPLVANPNPMCGAGLAGCGKALAGPGEAFAYNVNALAGRGIALAGSGNILAGP